jgi:hypothetical protein
MTRLTPSIKIDAPRRSHRKKGEFGPVRPKLKDRHDVAKIVADLNAGATRFKVARDYKIDAYNVRVIMREHMPERLCREEYGYGRTVRELVEKFDIPFAVAKAVALTLTPQPAAQVTLTADGPRILTVGGDSNPKTLAEARGIMRGLLGDEGTWTETRDDEE